MGVNYVCLFVLTFVVHQAQLANYNQDLVLASQRVVSYHKFKKVLNEVRKWVITTDANVDEYYSHFPDLRSIPHENSKHSKSFERSRKVNL